MIGSIFKAILGNWQVALGAIGLLILSHTLAYCEGRSDGRESVKAELRAAEAETLKKAAEARSKADALGEQRALEEAEVAGDMIERIEEAEAESGNPLDAMLEGW